MMRGPGAGLPALGRPFILDIMVLPRFLHLSTDYSGKLDLEAERVALESYELGHYDLRVRTLTEPARIAEVLRNSAPAILQISCHVELIAGVGTIPSRFGHLDFDELARILRVGLGPSGRLHLLVLAACHSQYILHTLTEIADIVIGFRDRVADSDVRRMLPVLYGRLFAEGESVADAVDNTRELDSCGTPSTAGLVLAHAPHIDPTQVFLGGTRQWAMQVPRNDVPLVLAAYYAHESVRDRAAANPHDRDAELVLESANYHYEKQGYPPGGSLPLVCRIENLEVEGFWPDREFGIQLLHGGLTWQSDDRSCRVEVDLREQKLGIYSNAGKRFLGTRFPLAGSDAVERAQLFHDQVRNIGRSRSSHPPKRKWAFDNPPHRLRWASAGYLPVVRWRGQRWFALFFRDIPPIGWNIANGASNDSTERRRPSILAVREAKEELVVVEHPPEFDMESHRIALRFGEIDEFDHDAEPLLSHHDRLRLQHDRITIKRSSMTLPVRRIAGRTSVRVYDSDAIGADLVYETAGVYVSINPVELGIEVTSVGEFDLPDHAAILDGETRVDPNQGQHQLIRRPVALFSLADFARRIKREAGTEGPKNLGAPIPGDERRRLDFQPEMHLFDFDVDARMARCRKDAQHSHRERTWLETWGGDFAAARAGELRGELLTLCPATWRAIELAIDDIVSYRNP